jgi:hypothetical protein
MFETPFCGTAVVAPLLARLGNLNGTIAKLGHISSLNTSLCHVLLELCSSDIVLIHCFLCDLGEYCIQVQQDV